MTLSRGADMSCASHGWPKFHSRWQDVILHALTMTNAHAPGRSQRFRHYLICFPLKKRGVPRFRPSLKCETAAWCGACEAYIRFKACMCVQRVYKGMIEQARACTRMYPAQQILNMRVSVKLMYMSGSSWNIDTSQDFKYEPWVQFPPEKRRFEAQVHAHRESWNATCSAHMNHPFGLTPFLCVFSKLHRQDLPGSNASPAKQFETNTCSYILSM